MRWLTWTRRQWIFWAIWAPLTLLLLKAVAKNWRVWSAPRWVVVFWSISLVWLAFGWALGLPVGTFERWPRWTTRHWLAQISILAVLMGFLVPFFRVTQEDGYHKHVWLHVLDGGNPVGYAVGDVRSPTWPRYRNALMGRPWRGVSFCRRAGGRLGEVCGQAHPELKVSLGPGRAGLRPSPALEAEYNRLMAIDSRGRHEQWERSPLREPDGSPLQ